MSLQKKKKAELIDIILRKDEVEAQLREDIKSLNNQLDDVEGQLEAMTVRKDGAIADVKGQTQKTLKLREENAKLKKHMKIAKIVSIAILVIAITIGVILLV